MPKTDSEFTQAQKREMAGHKSVISNPKSTPEAKAKAEKKLKQLMHDEKFEVRVEIGLNELVFGREQNPRPPTPTRGRDRCVIEGLVR
ncbi:hypothetical protein FRC18_008303 [Serendipita sp. 400]|nr:hypothetical protein FRC18_008303 [Serendipita sp. 400]